MRKRSNTHMHPCQHCGVNTPCAGDLIANYDGVPPVICDIFDLGWLSGFRCEECQTLVSSAEAEDAKLWPPAWIFGEHSAWGL